MSFDDAEGQQELLKRKRDQDLDDVRILLRCPSGRRFFRRILAEGRFFQANFSSDHAQASFWEGHRNFALQFLNDLVEVAPEHLATVLSGKEDIAV